jgi:hypothetical protein
MSQTEFEAKYRLPETVCIYENAAFILANTYFCVTVCYQEGPQLSADGINTSQ